MIKKFIHLFFGRKCSICNQKMYRSLDKIVPSWGIHTTHYCSKCSVWIFEKNFSWSGSTYKINEFELSIWVSNPTKGFIEHSSGEVHLWTIPINRIYLSAEDIAAVRRTIDHLLLLS